MPFSRNFDGNKREGDGRFRDVTVRNLHVIHATDRAILVIDKEVLETCVADKSPTAPFKHWVPRSQIRQCDPPLLSVDKDDTVTIVIPKWLAEEKEFLYE